MSTAMAVTLETQKTLVLNHNWTPIKTVSLRKALERLVSVYESTGQPKASVVVMEGDSKFQILSWDDWAKMEPIGEKYIQSAKRTFRVPEVIILHSEYAKLPAPRKTFSRRTLFRRDNYRCQYCACQPGTEELTIDHVLPRSQGGVTTWENCVLACVSCNARKANRTPEQAKMKLLCGTPSKPKYSTLKQEFHRIDSWQAFLGECYWTMPLSE